jgi:hypothetical protein
MLVRRVRTLALIVAALAVIGASPVRADDGEDVVDDETTPLRLLVSEVAAEIRAITEPPLPGVADLAESVGDRVPRVDLFVGQVRVAAAERVLREHPELGLTVHDLVVSGPGLLFDRAEGEGEPHRRIMERTARLWARVEELLAELRDVVVDRAPVRMCPVAEPTGFEDDWHDDRPRGRVHKGTDLHAERGTALLAIEAGTVVQANWHRAGGRQIYFRADSTGDVYYYAHLDTWAKWIWTGTRLSPGDEIGTVGRSGNADSPHLHFGWMPGSRVVDLDNLQNPYSLLVELCS